MKNRNSIPEQRFERGKQESNEGLIKKLVIVVMVIGVLLWIFKDIEPAQNEFDQLTKEYDVVEGQELTKELAEVITEKEMPVVEEEKTVGFYYDRAIKREEEKDYKGTIADYTQTISLAKKYSSEMWNSLNNGGIIKTQQFKNYKSALKDFNRIIEIEPTDMMVKLMLPD